MLVFELERKLRRLFGGPAPLGQGHARALEAELFARFDQLYPDRKVVPMKRLWRRKVLVAAAAAAIFGAAACVVPADMDVVVGHRVTVHMPEGAALPEPEAIVAAAQGNAQHTQVRVMMDTDDKTLTVEVWGDETPEGRMADRIRAAFPALAKAQIDEEALEGTMRSTVAKKLSRDLLKLDLTDAKDVETVRRDVMAQLAARGVHGKVDVRMEGEGSDKRVKVRVERQEPAQGEDAPKP